MKPQDLVKKLAIVAVVGFPAVTLSAENELRVEHGRFHHVHINVTDIGRTTAFYQKVFGVVPIRYGDKHPALMTERSFVFMKQVSAPIKSQLLTGLIHIGWSGIDGKNEFEWWKKEGIEFYTPLSPFGVGEYMYLYGPDREVIEIWTNERHHRLNHIHLLSTDPKGTAEWFARAVHSESPAARAGEGIGFWSVKVDNVTLHVLPDTAVLRPKERGNAPIQPTDGSGIDHLSFSFRDLNGALKRIEALQIPIERPVGRDTDYGLENFFVRAPNGVLVEFVKAKPLPDAAWE